jgi:hypothetical protein
MRKPDLARGVVILATKGRLQVSKLRSRKRIGGDIAGVRVLVALENSHQREKLEIYTRRRSPNYKMSWDNLLMFPVQQVPHECQHSHD